MLPHLTFGLVLILLFCLPNGAQSEQDTPHISLEQSVHFLSPGGDDVVVNPGTYLIEQREAWLRLTAGERTDAILIQAETITHGDSLESVQALSVEGESDRHHLLLLFPQGHGMESVGTYSGIRSRSGFSLLSPAKRTVALKILKQGLSSPRMWRDSRSNSRPWLASITSISRISSMAAALLTHGPSSRWSGSKVVRSRIIALRREPHLNSALDCLITSARPSSTPTAKGSFTATSRLRT